MKVYFVASPRVVWKEPEMFRSIHHHLAKKYTMLSDLLLKWTDKKSYTKPEEVLQGAHEDRVKGVQTSLNMIRKADVVVMEISGHSMSMGYLTAVALDMSKPVVYIRKKDSDPHWMDGLVHQKLLSFTYESETVLAVLDEAIDKAKQLIDVRFNFFISPEILAYLDYVARKRMLPRAVFLRRLIEKEMGKESEYQKM